MAGFDNRDGAIGIPGADRFGDYGTVGFFAISFVGKTPLLRDWVMSCRVARKMVEPGIFRWLGTSGVLGSSSGLDAVFIPTKRNHVLLDALLGSGFLISEEQPDGTRMLRLDLDQPIPGDDIVAVDVVGLARRDDGDPT